MRTSGLRGRVQGLEDEMAGLKAQFAYAWSEVAYLRAQINRPMLQAAEPVERKPSNLVPVSETELEAVLMRLREVRPLPLA